MQYAHWRAWHRHVAWYSDAIGCPNMPQVATATLGRRDGIHAISKGSKSTPVDLV